MKVLLVVDAQNDFIDGVLGSAEAQAALPFIEEKVDKALKEGTFVLFTQDTHFEDYMNTQEGRNLPVPHCIEDTDGWRIAESVDVIGAPHIKKYTFGDATIITDIEDAIQEIYPGMGFEDIEEIEICGFCTDICIISNCLILQSMAALYDIPIVVDAKACAGVTPEKHQAALEVMKSCQIKVIE